MAYGAFSPTVGADVKFVSANRGKRVLKAGVAAFASAALLVTALVALSSDSGSDGPNELQTAAIYATPGGVQMQGVIQASPTFARQWANMQSEVNNLEDEYNSLRSL